MASNSDENITNWASLLKSLLYKTGFGYVWLHQYVENESQFISEFKQRITDIALQRLTEDMDKVSDNRLYKHLTSTSTLNDSNYLLSLFLSFKYS